MIPHLIKLCKNNGIHSSKIGASIRASIQDYVKMIDNNRSLNPKEKKEFYYQRLHEFIDIVDFGFIGNHFN